MRSSTDSRQDAGEPASAKRRRRTRISDTATALFFERGFDSVSIADIAAAADVSKMTVTNHFALKEDLIFDEFGDELDVIRAHLAAAASIADAVDAIEDYCVERELRGGAARALAAHDDAWPAFAGVVVGSRTLTQRFHAHYVDVRDAIAGTLPATIDPHDAAVAAWMLAETVHLVDWWPFDAVAQGMPAVEIRAGRGVVRERAFAALRAGLRG